jgi:hypothetical protein
LFFYLRRRRLRIEFDRVLDPHPPRR